MIFALGENQVIQGFGLPAAIVIVGLATALIFTVRLLLVAYTRLDTIQESRLADAKQTMEKITEPLEKQSRVVESIYDLILNRSK
jgi:hypothetical protein